MWPISREDGGKPFIGYSSTIIRVKKPDLICKLARGNAVKTSQQYNRTITICGNQHSMDPELGAGIANQVKYNEYVN